MQDECVSGFLVLLTRQSLGGAGEPKGTTLKTHGLYCSPKLFEAQHKTCPCPSSAEDL